MNNESHPTKQWLVQLGRTAERINAHTVEVLPSGVLLFKRQTADGELLVKAYNCGNWCSFELLTGA